jgi:RNA methyltransferase, TrmH family
MAADALGLVHAAYRDPAMVVLEGFHPLKHALRFGAVIEGAWSPDPAIPLNLARQLAPDVEALLASILAPVPEEIFRRLCPQTPDTAVVAIARRPAQSLAQSMASRRSPAVLLDRPTHMGNLGAVIRVAAAADAAAVLVSGAGDPWHPAAIRGSAGLHFALPVHEVSPDMDLAGSILALDAAGEPFDPAAMPKRAIFLFGSERHGISAPWRARADATLALPMRPGVSSLNLATSVAAVLYAQRLLRAEEG